jgi:hypothetical protein
VETTSCSFQLDPRGFVHAVMKPGCRMGLSDAVENVSTMFEIGGRQRSRVLVDMRQVHSQTREARLYFGGAEAEAATLAVAILIGSRVSRVLANFFLRVSRQRLPTALFTQQDAAVTWLLEHGHARG